MIDRSFAAVVGGVGNTASGLQSFVGGGLRNSASATDSTALGGTSNHASGSTSIVLGGIGNTASGALSIAAGRDSCAGGLASWAAGNHAKVRPGSDSGALGAGCDSVASSGDGNGDEGTFIWADSQFSDFVSTGPDQFLVRARGGIYLGGNSAFDIPDGRFINTSTGAYLSSSGAWTNSSSRALKTGFSEVDASAVLDKVLQLPLQTWNYRADPDVRHLGPIAEDFHASFRLGLDATSIRPMDASGVALAAIEGLNLKLNEDNAKLRAELAAVQAEVDAMRELAERNAELVQRNADMESRLAALEALLLDGHQFEEAP